jgi:hypothetical protein
MDYLAMTAPCGRDCFNCPLHLAKTVPALRERLAKKFGMAPEKVPCSGCREEAGRCELLHHLGFGDTCKIYACAREKQAGFCYECADFPCDLLQPLADRADQFPHNLKVYNLCLIKKMGLENWAKNKAKEVFDSYYKKKLDL